MKLYEVANINDEVANTDNENREDLPTEFDPHEGGWINRAVTLASTDLIQNLEKEAEQEPDWFITSTRASRLERIIIVMLITKLLEVSNGEWVNRDFMGREHSDAIDIAIRTIRSRITPIFVQLRLKALTKRKEDTDKLHDQTSSIGDQERQTSTTEPLQKFSANELRDI